MDLVQEGTDEVARTLDRLLGVHRRARDRLACGAHRVDNLDKYAGDALYAAMVYVLISLVWQTSPLRKAVLAMLIMTALEVFQLTMIPAHMLASENLAERILARLLGTEFSFLDLLAYAVGILGVFVPDQAKQLWPPMNPDQRG